MRRLRARFEEAPVEAEGKGDGDQDQNDVTGDIKRIKQNPKLPGKHRVQSIDDHPLQHEHGETDCDLRGGADVARACRDKLQHAGIGGYPRECAEPGEQKDHERRIGAAVPHRNCHSEPPTLYTREP